jgi:hypothetical protein
MDRVGQAGRERVLGRQPVVDGQHRLPAAYAQLSAQLVVTLEVADHPTTAVQVHEHAQPGFVRRPVQTGGHSAGVNVTDLVHHGDRRADLGPPQLASLLRGLLFERGVAEGLDDVEQRPGLRVKPHDSAAGAEAGSAGGAAFFFGGGTPIVGAGSASLFQRRRLTIDSIRSSFMAFWSVSAGRASTDPSAIIRRMTSSPSSVRTTHNVQSLSSPMPPVEMSACSAAKSGQWLHP